MQSLLTNTLSINAQKTYRITGIDNQKASEKLSSGKRVNRAGDDAAAMSISTDMMAQVRSLKRATQNIGEGLALIGTAEGAIAEVSDMLKRMRELTIQASNDTYTDADREMIQVEMDELVEEIDHIANHTEFNGIPLLNGTGDIHLRNLVDTDTQQVKTDYPDYVEGASKKTVSLPKGTTPTQNPTTIEHVKQTDKYYINEYLTHEGKVSDYQEAFPESLRSAGGWRDVYNAQSIEKTITTTQAYDKVVTDNSEFLGSPTAAKPEDCVSENGLPMPKTESNQWGTSVNMYCALTEAKIQLNPEAPRNLYNLASTQTVSPDGYTVTNEYIIDNALKITQKIFLTDGVDEDSYKMGFEFENITNPVVDINFDFKFAMDALNAYDANKHASVNGESGEIDTDEVKVTIEKSGDCDIRFGCIDNLVSGDGIGATPPVNPGVFDNHTGAAIYFNNKTLAPGDKITGAMNYKATFKVDYYSVETKTEFKNRSLTVDTNTVTTNNLFVPTQLYIQSGANEGQFHGVMLPNLTADALKLREISLASSALRDRTLARLDIVIDRVGHERARFGAKHNTLEHTTKVNDIGEVNLSSTISQLIDTDMAKEMMAYTKTSVLQQASQSMIAQANQAPERLIQLLQA